MNTDAEPGLPPPSRRIITHELSRNKPEEFKGAVLADLHHAAPKAGKVWDNLERDGLVSEARLSFDPNSWVSRNDIGLDMILGTAPLDRQTKERLMFEDASFDYAKEVEYRLTHELTHIAIHNLVERHRGQHPQVNNLVDISRQMRQENPSKGLSTLGNIPFYKSMGADAQGLEDATELVAQYLWNPQYLRRYLSFLSDSSYAETRQGLGLEEITSSQVLEWYSMIKSVADAALQ